LADGGSIPPASTKHQYGNIRRSPLTPPKRGVFYCPRSADVRRNPLQAGGNWGQLWWQLSGPPQSCPQYHCRVPPSRTPSQACCETVLPVFAKSSSCPHEHDDVSLPDSLKTFVDEQVSLRGYGTSSKCGRQLIRRDQDRLQLRNLLRGRASPAPAAPLTETHFEDVREPVSSTAEATAKTHSWSSRTSRPSGTSRMQSRTTWPNTPSLPRWASSTPRSRPTRTSDVILRLDQLAMRMN